MTANWRPDLSYQVAFNADPNQQGSVACYSDLTTLLRGGRSIVYGRQYELDETQANAPEFVLHDVDEYLNPANTSSPYYPNVDLYRATSFQAVWPNDGTTVNYLNTGAPVPVPNGYTSFRVPDTESLQQTFYDPGFESYTAGDSVPWILPLPASEGPAPVVSTTNPRTGTNDITYDLVGTVDTPWGVQWPVPCIPGRQYTASAYIRQSSASTQSIRVLDQNQVVDNFTRTTANGWGTATFVGGAWSTSGGAGSNYSTTPGLTATPWYGYGYHSQSAVNTRLVTFAGSAIADSTQYVLVTVPVLATGGEIDVRLISRYADASNYYFCELRFNTDSTVGIRIQRRVAGTNTAITSATLGFTYTAGSQVWLRFDTYGPSVRAKAWLFNTVEGNDWTLDFTDSNITAAGSVGCGSILNASNTNTLPVALSFQRYSAIGSVSGTTTTTTGSYVRLSVTWTATRPVHLIQLATTGAQVAGTVYVDDLQHEQAAAASTYTSTGPVIYDVFQGFVERWPAQWHPDSQGFEGIAELTCVDGFGPLNETALLAAYPHMVLSLNPALYWPLWDESASTVFAEVTGFGPPLRFDVSKYGGGVAPEAGATTAILGDPQGVAVRFTPTGSPTSATQAVTVLAAGPLNATTPVLLPAVIGSSWAMTASAWIQFDDNSSSQWIMLSSSSVAGSFLCPIGLGTQFGTGFPEVIYQGPTSSAVALGTTNVFDGLPHHIAGTITQDATNTILTIYVDGVQEGTSTTSTATLGFLPQQATSVVVGGIHAASLISIANGLISHVAIWNRALSATEVDRLGVQAGGGWSDETSGRRVSRYLTGLGDVAGPGPVGVYRSGPVSIDEGMSVMGPDDLVTGTRTLEACQGVATTENGMFWGSPIALSFSSRARRYLQTASLYTFGEDQTGGEYPYQTDIGFDWDPTLVFNPVIITNTDGIVSAVSNPDLQQRYFGKTLSRTINVLDDNEAIDAANYLLAQHARPRMRVANLVLDPASNPTLWPIVLKLQINDRVTVKRRAKAANSGVGLTMSADYFVEKISHDEINLAGGEWKTTVQLSPVDVSQVWILDDTTYSVLGTTTILGY